LALLATSTNGFKTWLSISACSRSRTFSQSCGSPFDHVIASSARNRSTSISFSPTGAMSGSSNTSSISP